MLVPVMEQGQPVVVLVEDDEAIADLVELYLRRDGYHVHRAGTGDRAFPDPRPYFRTVRLQHRFRR